ncbi:Aspartate aminotransferase [Rubripirellula lacrimiformis]|uniref:Aspartate aminotransferase n=1 Tax=Rubripirellula lacrimiformis TaxID=1930273 RepID=A0A517NKW1_9BACT|nr:amino acid aminotransferase [Rubripirellula lacrimiformis]QDT07683.1 Aspartate aminotransferase [Rubripirellula lacrimiformis]
MTATSKPSSRFIGITTAPPDAILGLTEAFAADTNPQKMNLSVGVYKDASGQTPVLKCVKAAEKWLVENEKTKGYLPIDGQADYRRHVRNLIFGDCVESDRVSVVQTPGGTGALRVAAGFLNSQLAPIRVWISTPTWANHNAVFTSEHVPQEAYRYLADDKKSFDLDGMIDDLTNNTRPGDAVLLHACCHNPTGVDPTAEQWDQIASVVAEKRLLPIIDFAYQGFGNGLAEDTVAVRAILKVCDEAIVCSSFSKNFGLYSERVGAISILSGDAEMAGAVQSQLKTLVRSNYSNPPRHGAAVVATILDDADLTQMWHDELTEMRTRIKRLRQQFVETMKKTGKGHDFGFLLDQNGMFSFSGLNKMQVDELKNKHSIYIVGSGRINVAGMSEDRMDQLCAAIADVIEN